MARIISLQPLDNHCLEVALDNGSAITLNMGTRLQTIRFGPLADPVFFGQATTDGRYVRWGNQIEISVNELIQLAMR